MVLRIYEPHECDEAGVPLDWERCRRCIDRPGIIWMKDGTGDEYQCPDCEGHGSLKAAALVAAEKVASAEPFRCEDCGHPMSEGTWEAPQGPPVGHGPGGVWGPPDSTHHAEYLAAVERWLRTDDEDPLWAWVHYSSCDENCRHGGPGRIDDPRSEQKIWWESLSPRGMVGTKMLAERPGCVQASWRQVDVRCLSWPHDLRPEKLAILCLRCWAKRCP